MSLVKIRIFSLLSHFPNSAYSEITAANMNSSQHRECPRINWAGPFTTSSLRRYRQPTPRKHFECGREDR